MNEEGEEPTAAEESTEASTPTEASPDELAQAKQQLEEALAKADEYLKHLQRVQADFVNYRRRTEQERGEQRRFENAALIRRLLPVLDDFERAFQAVPSSLARLTWLEGILLIYRKLFATLEQEGLKPIEALDQPFDPLLHEAIAEEEVEPERAGKVTSELQRGYRLHDRVLRPTLVAVGKAKAEAKPTEAPAAAGETTPDQPPE